MINKAFYLGLGMIALSTTEMSSKETPNIILIMADDMGWGDVGFNGNTIIKTPNLDALAADGLIMQRFYAGAPLSSPTRASVLTGRNAFRSGIFSANVGLLREEETTVAELLKTGGYATGMFGKWHLGTLTYEEKDANRGRPENKHLYNPPSRHGFDASFVAESKVPTFDPMLQPVTNDGNFWDYIREGEPAKAYGTAYWNHEGERVTQDLSGDDSRVIMDRVFPFMDKSINDTTPFLSVIWFHTPHLPCVAGPEHVAQYENLSVEERNYYGCITALDEQIGRLVNYLKAKGEYNNTIILFCSDNGPELETPGSPGRFKGKKRSLYEGGIRVPSIICWPDKIKGGSQLAEPCSTNDYLPTLLDITGIASGNIHFDGESIWPMITQGTKRNNPLVFCSGKQGAVIDSTYKLYYSKGKFELYDIPADSEEENDIITLHPNESKKLQTLLKQTMEDYKRSFDSIGEGNWQKWWNIWD